jgi:hypothetical protein
MFNLQLNVYTAAISSVNKIVINEWLRLNFIGFLMMSLKAPFFMKRRSPLNPESSRTLIVLFLTISFLLALLSCLKGQFGHDLACFCYKLVI